MQTMKYFLFFFFQIRNLGCQPDNNIFGIGYHNENSIVERKIQTLTLGSRTLLLHGNRYWPKAITTMFCIYALKTFA